MEVIGILNPPSTEEEAYAQTNERVKTLEDNAVMLNGFFDDTLGWWQQAKGEDKREDSVIVHGREIVQNTGNIEVSPAACTQTIITYYADDGEKFTRVAGDYHEVIVQGAADVDGDSSTPNFTAAAATCYNKAKGNVGVTAVTGRVCDVHYTNAELADYNGHANKSCGGFFYAERHADYEQGGYSIGMETYTLNYPDGDSLDDSKGYPGNPDAFDYIGWQCGYHCVGGGKRPISAGILINGLSASGNGMYNGIVIGASAMRINDGNSPDTVGVNMASWTPAKHGFYGTKCGYAPRFAKVNGLSLTESEGVKFLNPDGNMPVAISAVEEYTDNGNTVKGVPYLDFKIGTASVFYDVTGKPVERPNDTTRARVGYDSNTSSMNLSSDGSIKFRTGRNYSDNTVQTVDYTMSGSGLVPSSAVNLGSSANKWDNIYANADVITTSDMNMKEDIQDIDERLLKAWSKVNYKVFRFKNGKRRHVGVIAQEIQSAFESEGLNAKDFGLFCEDKDENGNIVLGVRYSECLALECALLRKKIGA